MSLEAAYCKVCPVNAQISIRDFFHDIRYIFLFYVIGDIATTVFALENGLGYEANSIIAGFLVDYGYASLVLIKLLFLFTCFLDYVYLKERDYLSTWNATRYCVSLLGILVVANNLLVIGGAASPLGSLLEDTNMAFCFQF